MKKILLLFLLSLTLISCQSNDTTTSVSINYQSITPEDALFMIENNHQVMIIDVRTPSEFKEGHIPDAWNVPLAELDVLAKTLMPDKNIPYLIYCRSGNRSLQAITILSSLGYTNLYDLGGIIDWPYDIQISD